MSENSETALAHRHTTDLGTPNDLITQATAQATALSRLIEDRKLYSNIGGRKYVRVEGWVPLARMNGVIPRETQNEGQPDGRYIARVQLVRVADGVVLTEASGECGGPDEPMWQNRPPYARRSMAATRATGKACRLAYSWVIALAGYEATPAEEMDDAPMFHGQAPTRSYPVVPATVVTDTGDDWVLDFGKHKGESIRAVDNGYLHFLMSAREKDLADPEKARFIPKIQNDIRRLNIEKARRLAMAAEAEAEAKPGAPLNDPNDLFA